MSIKRALISVSDKTGVIELCQALTQKGVELISTGGTAHALQEAGLTVTAIDEVTGFPEMMDGRVKTLHPKIHGGLLALRANSAHQSSAQEHDIKMIDLVVVNLYPFEQTIARQDVSLQEAIENIDIGGPSMLRSAAKNYHDVIVLSDPTDYQDFLREFNSEQGVSQAFRSKMACKVFSLTARYDGAISSYLQRSFNDQDYGQTVHLTFERVNQLRYGENPHQQAALYVASGHQETSGVAGARLFNGKALSYNNLIDADGAWNLVQEFDESACAIIKHTNPCGCALGRDSVEAFEKAWESDPVSAFGSIIAFNRPVDEKTAQAIVTGKRFVEVICAPDFSSQAVQTLSSRKGWGENLRLMAIKPTSGECRQLRSIEGGLLIQDHDTTVAKEYLDQARQASGEERRDLIFAWLVVKHVKSNAITVARNGQLLGVGAGQMNRVQSVQLALEQAGDKAQGAVLASDAFFPFRDSIDLLARSGIKAVIQPGGSKKDQEVIDACREHDIAMIFTGMRHFKHG